MILYGFTLFQLSWNQNEGSDSMTGLDWRWFIKFFVPLGFVVCFMAVISTWARLAAFLWGNEAQSAEAVDKLEIFADDMSALEEARLAAEKALEAEAAATAQQARRDGGN